MFAGNVVSALFLVSCNPFNVVSALRNSFVPSLIVLSGSYVIRERNNESAADAARRSEPLVVCEYSSKTCGGERRWEVGAIRYAEGSRLRQSVANASVRNVDKFPEELSGKMLDIMARRREFMRDYPETKLRAYVCVWHFRKIVSTKTKANFNALRSSMNFYRS